MTECLFTQLLERRVRVVKHSSNGRALMQAASPDVRGADTTRRVRSTPRDANALVASRCWDRVEFHFHKFLPTYTPRGHFSNNTHRGRRSSLGPEVGLNEWFIATRRAPNATDVSMTRTNEWRGYALNRVVDKGSIADQSNKKPTRKERF